MAGQGETIMSARDRSKVAAGSCAIALLLLSGTAYAAQSAAPATPAPAAADAAAKPLDNLAEVVVSAEKPTRKAADLIAWIRRLLGKYTFEGKVDLGGKGNPNDRWSVNGGGTCIGFGVAPGVQCEINVHWPPVPGPNAPEILSGISDLTPAMILYAMEPDDLGIRYLQVNSKGLAEGSTGTIIGDTATFKTPCVNVAKGCERTTRITVGSESKIIDMQIDTEVNYELVARFSFKLRRVAQLQAPAPPPEPPAAPANKPAQTKPQSTQPTQQQPQGNRGTQTPGGGGGGRRR
jgi:hypothetical protein